MKNIYLFLFLSVVFAFTACDESNEPFAGSEELIGYWISPNYGDDSMISYKRAASLIENKYGLALEADGKLIERSNSGWCGTPPVSLSDYEGSWRSIDSMIYITTQFWGGPIKYDWKLILVDNDELVVKVTKTVYPEGL